MLLLARAVDIKVPCMMLDAAKGLCTLCVLPQPKGMYMVVKVLPFAALELSTPCGVSLLILTLHFTVGVHLHTPVLACV